MSIYPLFEFPWEGRTLVEEAPEPPRVILKQNMLKTIKFICVSIFNLAGRIHKLHVIKSSDNFVSDDNCKKKRHQQNLQQYVY